MPMEGIEPPLPRNTLANYYGIPTGRRTIVHTSSSVLPNTGEEEGIVPGVGSVEGSVIR